VLIDLHFCSKADSKKYRCDQCPETIKKQRKCQEDGFHNLQRGRRVDDNGILIKYCPGKATWYPAILKLFEECRFAYQTGILPRDGTYREQSMLFCEVYPHFVAHWESRRYLRTWSDVFEFTPKVLEALSKIIGSMFGGKPRGRN
jgi:hypothetical protein